MARGRPRSPNPSPEALRARRHYERMRGRDPQACAQPRIGGDVITMLVRRGLLPDYRVPTRGEVDDALSIFLREEADKQF